LPRRGGLPRERGRRRERVRAAGRHSPCAATGGDLTAISIHIYGTDVSRIGSSVRRYYEAAALSRAAIAAMTCTDGTVKEPAHGDREGGPA
jgi:hypothetical protein